MRDLIIAFLLFCCGMLQAQQLKVIEFRADLSMTDASRFPQEDFNGDRCGLIKLGLTLPVSDVAFEGDIISSENKAGEWWIYMPKGSNWLTIKSKSSTYLPLRCEFSEYGIDGIESNVTYVMNVEKPSVDSGPVMKKEIADEDRIHILSQVDVSYYVKGEFMKKKLYSKVKLKV